LFNGGGRVFGPQPRDYSFKLNKKLKALARKSALSYKAKDNSIVVLEDFQFRFNQNQKLRAVNRRLKCYRCKNIVSVGHCERKCVFIKQKPKENKSNYWPIS